MPIEWVEGVADFIVIVFPLCTSCGFGMVDYSLLAVERMIGELFVPSSRVLALVVDLASGVQPIFGGGAGSGGEGQGVGEFSDFLC